MHTKKIYFSGGSFHELQKLFSGLPGVIKVRTGYLNADGIPGYEAVASGAVSALMGVMVEYNPKKIDISKLLDVLFAAVTPYLPDGQGGCRGAMYQSGVYYAEAEDAPQVELHMNFIANRGRPPAATGAKLTLNDPNSDPKLARRCYAKAARLKSFHEAEPEQQDYLAKHPEAKTYIDFAKLQEYLRF